MTNYKSQYKTAKSDFKRLKTYKKKKVYRKKAAVKTGYAITTLLHTPLMPIKKYGKLPYNANIAWATGAAVIGGYVFTANGLYDPDITGVGHQPMGFDQALAFYEHYTCVANEVTVTFCSGAANNDAIACGFYLSSSATPVTVSDQIVENGLLYRKILTSNVNNSKDIQTISAKINLTKFFGKKIINEDDYRGNAAALPTEQAYMIFFVNNLSGTNTNPVIMDITTNYTVKFTEPKKIPQS